MSKASKLWKRLGAKLGAKLGSSGGQTKFPPHTGLVVHALHKSASMYLYKFFVDLCEKTDCRFHSIHNSPADDHAIPVDTRDGFVLCPVRNFNCNDYQFPELDRVNYLIQVRDPRDILVSEYFSLGWLHTSENWSQESKDRRRKIQSMSIDEFVLDERFHGKQPLIERMTPVVQFAKQDNVSVVKYETLVTQFPVWLETVMQFSGLGEAYKLKQELIHQYKDEFTPDDSEGGHKRNVVPGDFRQKLSPQTIQTLNQRFAPILQSLDYLTD